MPNAHTPCDFAVWSSIAFSRFQRSGATRGCNVAPTAQGDKPSGTETELPGSGDPWKTDRRQNLPAQGEVDAVWKIPFHDHHEQYSHFGKFHQVPQREEYGLFARSDSS